MYFLKIFDINYFLQNMQIMYILTKLIWISSLKPMGQFEPNLAWVILHVCTFQIGSDVPANQPTWPLLLWTVQKVGVGD